MRIHKYKYTIHTFTEIARWVASMWLIRNLAMYRAPASIGLSRPLFILPTVKPRLITHPPYIYKPEKHQSLYNETCSTFSFLIHSWWNISNTHQSYNHSSCLSDREWLTRFWSAQSLHLTFWDLRYTTVDCFSDVPPFLWSTTDIPLHCFFGHEHCSKKRWGKLTVFCFFAKMLTYISNILHKCGKFWTDWIID